MIPPRRGLNLNTVNTKMNTKVLLSCANGNSLIGAPEITCLPSGNWSAPFPICESKYNDPEPDGVLYGTFCTSGARNLLNEGQFRNLKYVYILKLNYLL
jgi:hypothetical protein